MFITLLKIPNFSNAFLPLILSMPCQSHPTPRAIMCMPLPTPLVYDKLLIMLYIEFTDQYSSGLGILRGIAFSSSNSRWSSIRSNVLLRDKREVNHYTALHYKTFDSSWCKTLTLRQGYSLKTIYNEVHHFIKFHLRTFQYRTTVNPLLSPPSLITSLHFRGRTLLSRTFLLSTSHPIPLYFSQSNQSMRDCIN